MSQITFAPKIEDTLIKTGTCDMKIQNVIQYIEVYVLMPQVIELQCYFYPILLFNSFIDGSNATGARKLDALQG